MQSGNNTKAQLDSDSPKQNTKTKVARSAVSSLSLGSADDALTLAKELQKFVKANGLTTKIQGKDYPGVEAWQFAGTLLGLSPLLESIEDKSTEQEIKWNATVAVQNVRTGTIVGRGFATCSNKEYSKKSFADYAICSMAQTRAVGKAYRLSLGWLMKAAGYEATPAEEMSEVGTLAEVVAKSQAASAENGSQPRPKAGYTNEQIKAELDKSTAQEQLTRLWTDVSPAAQEVLVEFFTAARLRIEQQKNTPAPAVASPVISPAPAGSLPSHEAAGAPIVYATASQKEKIIRLLNHPVITRPEKTKMLLNINRLDEERANAAIAKLNKAIDERENGTIAGNLRGQLRGFAVQHADQLGEAETERLMLLCEDASIDANELRAELASAQESLTETAAA